jgi:SGNH domain (fused to AT3 domains)
MSNTRFTLLTPLLATLLLATACAPAAIPQSGAPTSAGTKANSPASPTTVQVAPSSPVALTPADQVLAAVASATSLTKLPAGLAPTLENAPTDLENVGVTGCKKSDIEPAVGRCVYGDKNGTKTVVLFGDSHAGMWLTSLHLAASRSGWQLRVFSKGGCPAPMMSFYDRQTNKQNTECDAARTTNIEAIKALHPAVVVVTSASFEQAITKDQNATSDMWQTGMTATLNGLSDPSIRLVVLGDMPVLEQTNPECLAAHLTDIQQCGSTREKALGEVFTSAEQAAATATGADYIDVSNWFCNEQCSPIIGGKQVYRNRYHVTATYATFASGALADALHLDK